MRQDLSGCYETHTEANAVDRSDGKSSPQGRANLAQRGKRWVERDERAKSRGDDRVFVTASYMPGYLDAATATGAWCYLTDRDHCVS